MEKTTTLIFRIPNAKKELVKAYADTHDMSLTELYRNAVLEKIEDEIDLKLLRNAMEESKDGDGLTLEEMKKWVDEG